MSKRRASSSDEDCCRAAKRGTCTCTEQGKRHLYVVLDDRHKAYTVHKLRIDDDGYSGDAMASPPFLRVEVPRDRDSCQFAALGHKIIALHSSRPLIHDTRTAALSIGSRPPSALSTHGYLTVAAAGRLYALPGVSAGDIYYLEEDRPLPAHLVELESDVDRVIAEHMRRSWREKQDKWVWSTAPSSQQMPFNPGDVTCHALHPDGRTVFVSVKRHPHTWMDHGTFSFDAGKGGGGSSGASWRRHGDWLLPFRGEAFFDAGLEAWVGLDELGHLCASNGMSRHAPRRSPPAWKRGKESVLREPDPDRRLGFALAYMGGGDACRFCVVERALRPGVTTRHASLGAGDKCVLHVTTFCVRYGKDGELTTTARRDAGSYGVSRHREFFRISAFYV